MTDAERAKQFLPYAALTGFEGYVQTAEAEKAERIMPGEDAQADLDRLLQSLRSGDIIWLRYYDGFHCLERRGTVKRIIPEEGVLRLKEGDVPLADILSLGKEREA